MSGRMKLDDLVVNDGAVETVIYKTAGSTGLRLLVQKPKEWRSSDQRTAVVWIHGGAWCAGAPESFLPHIRYFAGRGAIGFSIQYRLAGNPDKPEEDSSSTVLDCIEDCKSAIRFIRQHAAVFGINPGRIVAAGDSAGGHLALCLATLREFDTKEENPAISSVPNAVIDCNGIVDMTLKWKKYVPAVPGEDDVLTNWWMRHELAQRLSPIAHIHKGQPPMLIIHGLRDQIVEPEDAVRFFEKYRVLGNDGELILLPTARHAFICFQYTATNQEIFQAMHAIDVFLTARGFLQGEPALEL